MNHPASELEGIPYQISPPLMGGDQGEGEQRFCHPYLSSPIKGEEPHSNPVASYRELSRESDYKALINPCREIQGVGNQVDRDSTGNRDQCSVIVPDLQRQTCPWEL
jgi:hypothetical protein